MGAKIKNIAYYLPEKILTNQQLSEEFPEWGAEKIAEKIGIKQRHIAAVDETALDLAYHACSKLLKSVDKEMVDFILLCTQSPDYMLPTSACILQEKLGLRKNIGALDFNLGCSGFIYGVALAKGLINARIAENVLLVTAETYSKHIHPKDKANRSIFGDGAAATLITKVEAEHIGEFELGTDGSGMNNLILRNGALRHRFDINEKDIIDDSGNVKNNNNLYMNGPEIFNFTIDQIPGMIYKVLEKNKLTLEQINFVVLHQANKYILDYLRKKLKISADKFYINMENTGNTVSATIPIALKDCIDNNSIKTGDNVLISGFGVGYSWGATVIKI